MPVRRIQMSLDEETIKKLDALAEHYGAGASGRSGAIRIQVAAAYRRMTYRPDQIPMEKGEVTDPDRHDKEGD